MADGMLITGSGTSGSWRVRGEQIGKAIGARVCPQAGRGEFDGCDVAVVVKRATEAQLEALRAARKPWVFDFVDAYPQPGCATWSQRESIDWARKRLAHLNPTAVIWPNRRMRDDVRFNGPQAVIPHHARPGIAINPIREEVRTVGYEGSARYLEGWAKAISAECDARGWTFVVNPESLAGVDIVVAVRGGQWNSYCARHWKSNVKLANAHASGTPFIGAREDGYLETASGAEYWADSPEEMRVAFNWLADKSTREQVCDRFKESAIRLEAVAHQYKSFLQTL